MQESSSSNENNNNNNNNEVIVDKLQGALAAFRKERDGLHRQKSLAEERLRLNKEEMDGLAKNVASLEAKHKSLHDSGSDKAMKELQDLEREVSRLQNEVNFQHAELLAKRNKVDGMKKQLEEDCEKRHELVTKLKQQECHRRAQLSAPSKPKKKTLQDLKQALEHERIMGNHDQLLNNHLPRWMQLAAQRLSANADSIQSENERISRVLIGYKQRLDGGMEILH